MDDKVAHLLIVDDDDLNRQLLIRMLQPEYKLSEASNVLGALEILEKESSSIRLVISDYLMPGQSGLELAKEVRRRWPSISFVLLTGFESDEVIAVSEERGRLMWFTLSN